MAACFNCSFSQDLVITQTWFNSNYVKNVIASENHHQFLKSKINLLFFFIPLNQNLETIQVFLEVSQHFSDLHHKRKKYKNLLRAERLPVASFFEAIANKGFFLSKVKKTNYHIWWGFLVRINHLSLLSPSWKLNFPRLLKNVILMNKTRKHAWQVCSKGRNVATSDHCNVLQRPFELLIWLNWSPKNTYPDR